MDATDLLNTDASQGRVAMAAEVALAYGGRARECPRYLEALTQALETEPPPFDTARYAEIYLSAAEDWQWLAVSLITNAEREGDGAKRLWSLSACCSDDWIRPQLKQHAVDESRHARFYLALLDMLFAGRVDPEFRDSLAQLSPGYSLKQTLVPVEGSPYAKEPTVDDFIQMNIAEIRTAIHHIMQRPAVRMHCAPEKQRQITSFQDALLRDELKHVNYTAVLIENIAPTLSKDQLAALFSKRFRDFNQITLDELGHGAFDCSVACCARHDTCRPKVEVGGTLPAKSLSLASR